MFRGCTALEWWQVTSSIEWSIKSQNRKSFLESWWRWCVFLHLQSFIMIVNNEILHDSHPIPQQLKARREFRKERCIKIFTHSCRLFQSYVEGIEWDQFLMKRIEIGLVRSYRENGCSPTVPVHINNAVRRWLNCVKDMSLSYDFKKLEKTSEFIGWIGTLFWRADEASVLSFISNFSLWKSKKIINQWITEILQEAAKDWHEQLYQPKYFLHALVVAHGKAVGTFTITDGVVAATIGFSGRVWGAWDISIASIFDAVSASIQFLSFRTRCVNRDGVGEVNWYSCCWNR